MCGRLGTPGSLARRGMWSIRLSSMQALGRTRFDAGSVRLSSSRVGVGFSAKGDIVLSSSSSARLAIFSSALAAAPRRQGTRRPPAPHSPAFRIGPPHADKAPLSFTTRSFLHPSPRYAPPRRQGIARPAHHQRTAPCLTHSPRH
ncbi:hypothetical protein B0H17DRAFT_1193659 [Mycena rosella]|uniref:Uncharacterized protein n=1 Tax=Mycena rosella TaxID=1033263 RepID=A0AAD7GSQ7_MYCRO|nr:hypothetical protein B0H17DRAFT_1193659 [Mycena rosella]